MSKILRDLLSELDRNYGGHRYIPQTGDIYTLMPDKAAYLYYGNARYAKTLLECERQGQ
jgi:hypothetical protein